MTPRLESLGYVWRRCCEPGLFHPELLRGDASTFDLESWGTPPGPRGDWGVDPRLFRPELLRSDASTFYKRFEFGPDQLLVAAAAAEAAVCAGAQGVIIQPRGSGLEEQPAI